MHERPIRLQVTRPCPQAERTMTPVTDGWHCAGCNRVVLDLRDLTRDEALALMRARRDERGQCIAVDADEWGRSVFVGEALATLKRAASGVAIAATLAACGPEVADAPPVTSSSTTTPSASVAPPADPSEQAPTAPEAPVTPLEATDAGSPPGGEADAAADAGADAGPAPTAVEPVPPRRRQRTSPYVDPLVGLDF